MFYKPLAEIELSDLQLLVSNRVKENTQLDYKLLLPEQSDAGKKELLKDISAFANTNGGYLIYGIKEEEVDGKKTGVAGEITGIKGVNSNDLQLLIESSVRSNIEPRLVGLEFKEISIDDTNSVILIRVPRSWNIPHVVSFGNHWRFYGRNSAGNYPMDITQLRDIFTLGSTVPEKLEERRKERLSFIKQKYQTLSDGSLPVLVVHIQPFDSLKSLNFIDVFKARSDTVNLALRDGEYCPPTINFDGLLVENRGNYLQIFHSGMTEQVIKNIATQRDENLVIRARFLESITIQGVGWRLSLLKSLGVDSPVMVQVSVIGLNHHKLEAEVSSMTGRFEQLLPNAVDREDLIMSPILIDTLSNIETSGFFAEDNNKSPNSWNAAEKILKPAFDSLWSAFGLPSCLNYDKDKWVGQMKNEIY
jgi:hypothetical protein